MDSPIESIYVIDDKIDKKKNSPSQNKGHYERYSWIEKHSNGIHRVIDLWTWI